MTLAIDLDRYPVPLTLSCDARGCSTVQTFTEVDYPACRTAATKAGWLERQTDTGRMFFCAGCARGSDA